MNLHYDLVREICGPMAARRLQIVRAHESGQTLTCLTVMAQFRVSRATAKRDLAALRRALNVRPEASP